MVGPTFLSGIIAIFFALGCGGSGSGGGSEKSGPSGPQSPVAYEIIDAGNDYICYDNDHAGCATITFAADCHVTRCSCSWDCVYYDGDEDVYVIAKFGHDPVGYTDPAWVPLPEECDEAGNPWWVYDVAVSPGICP
jgi:hypothetical protein